MISQEMPSLSLCIIAKNEEKTLPRCLSSVREFIDEIVLVDTGSQDQTIQVAKQYEANVYPLVWVGDFSHAKNYAIEKARCDWILFLDADEELARSDAGKLKKTIRENNHHGFSLIQRTYLRDGNSVQSIPNPREYEIGKDYSDCVEISVIRLFKNDERIRFQGKVHEVVERSFENHSLSAIPIPFVIHHYGKVLDLQHVENKKNFYLELGYQKLAESPNNALAHYEMGVQLYELQKFKDCVQHLETALRLDPRMTLCLLALAKAYHMMLEMEEAEKYYKNCVNEHPGERVFFEYANFLRDQGHFKTALRYYKQCLDLNPKYAIAVFNLGGVYLRMNQPEKGFHYIKKSIQLNPDNETFLINYARLSLMTGHLETAIDYLEDYLGRSPENFRCATLLAQLYFKRGELAAALKWADRIIDLDSRNVEARLIKGNALWGLEQIEPAKAEFFFVLELDPINLECLLKLAALADLSGNFEESLHYYERILLAFPDHPFALKKAAAMIGRNRSDDHALGILKRACTENPNDSECLMLLGSIYEKRGDNLKAIEVYESSLERIPKIEPLLRRRLAKLSAK